MWMAHVVLPVPPLRASSATAFMLWHVPVSIQSCIRYGSQTFKTAVFRLHTVMQSCMHGLHPITTIINGNQAMSTALVTIDAPALPAVVRAEMDTARAFALAGLRKSLATRRAYKSDFRHFTRYCGDRGASPMPAAPDLVCAYACQPRHCRRQALHHRPARRARSAMRTGWPGSNRRRMSRASRRPYAASGVRSAPPRRRRPLPRPTVSQTCCAAFRIP